MTPAHVSCSEPRSVAAACEALRTAAAEGAAVGFEGGGTALELGYPYERLDRVIRTAGMNRVLEHAPADMTATVEAGVTLAQVQAHLAPFGQRLALDPTFPERATIGGILAANDYGPLRARCGSARDLTLGVQMVRADGTLIRGGGNVVKNVAGFDIPKLAIGSLGTLGLIVTATVRLHPIPAERRCVQVADLPAVGVRALVRACLEAQLEPATFVAARKADGAYAVDVWFEGFAPGCDEQSEALVAGAGGAARTSDSASDAVAATHAAARSLAELRVKATFPPSDLALRDYDAVAPLVAALDGAACVVYPTLGVAFCAGTVLDDERVVRALASARVAVERGGGALVLERAPARIRAHVDVFGTLPPSFALMRNLKQRFDPERRLSAGRFVGHL